jgi:hypothetical protein
MIRSATSRRVGLAQRLLLALLAGAIVLVLALLLRTKTPVGTRDAITAPPSTRPPRRRALSESAASARDALESPSGSAPTSAPSATALAGGAHLEGRVIDRATGAGVASARVELLPLPPAPRPSWSAFLDLLGLGSELPDSVRPIASTISADGRLVRLSTASARVVVRRRARSLPRARGERPRLRARLRARSATDPPLEIHVVPGGRVLGRVLAPDGQPRARRASS